MVLRERVKSGIEERESEEWYVTERVKSEEKREKREKRVKREEREESEERRFFFSISNSNKE